MTKRLRHLRSQIYLRMILKPYLGDQMCLQALFLENELKDFVDECFIPETLTQIQIQDSDIEKFLKGKPEQIPEDIAKRLPTWLVDFKSAFMPKQAEKLAPYRIWDHKIELLPGKEPPYFCNRPMSPAELKVVRK